MVLIPISMLPIKIKKRKKRIFSSNITEYTPNITEYIPKNNYTVRTWQTKIKNSFQIDFYFIRKLYNIKQQTNDTILKYIFEKGIYDGMIVHPKQLKNIFPNVQIFNYKKQLFIKIFNKSYIANNFYKQITPLTYNYFLKNSIRFIYKNFSYNRKFDINILFFIGNIEIGINIIQQINNLEIDFCLSIVVKKHIYIEKIKRKIKKNINFIIYQCNEFGNDIIPSILLYDRIKHIKFNYIIKIHTKTDTKWRKYLIDYLFKTDSNILKKTLNTTNINVVGCKKYLKDIGNSPPPFGRCKQLIIKYNNFIDKKYFIAGTMFFCKKELFEKMSIFIQENNFKQFLFNNMYDTNAIVKNSPIHFLERLFGIIK